MMRDSFGMRCGDRESAMPQLLPAAWSPVDEVLEILDGMTDRSWKRDREKVAALIRSVDSGQ